MCSFVVEDGVYEDVRSQGEVLMMVIECHVVQLPCQGVFTWLQGVVVSVQWPAPTAA